MLRDRQYVKECDECVLRNYRNKEYVIGPCYLQGRIKKILEFLGKLRTKESKILDIGSGGYMPVTLGATHACDISAVAGDLLKKSGFRGKFTVASCDALPYEDKEFDIAVLSEVLEHLPDITDVYRALREIERVAKTWIATTPCASKTGFRDKWNIEETHRQFMTLEDAREIVEKACPGANVKFEKVDHYVFIKRL